MGLLCPSLDTIGPLCRSARQLGPIYRALVGEDADDADWLGAAAAQCGRKSLAVSAMRFGVPRQLSTCELDAPVAAAFQLARSSIEATGAGVVEVDINDWDPGVQRRAGLLLTEAEAAAHWPQLMLEQRAGVSDSFKAMLRYGRDASSAKLVAASQAVRHAGASFARAICGVDAIMMPAAPQLPFAHGTSAPVNQADLTALANFSGAPAICLPVWMNQQPLPGSLQLLGARGCDAELIAIAMAIEAILPPREP